VIFVMRSVYTEAGSLVLMRRILNSRYLRVCDRTSYSTPVHSFVSKCIDWIQTRSLIGRKVPEHDPNGAGE